MIAEFGLAALVDAKGGTLSGGERRRVELARALASQPDVLLADEPFSALDPMATQQICNHLRRFAERGVGVLLTDHDVAHALELCDRIYILNVGQIIFVGTPEEVAQNPRVRHTYLGERFLYSGFEVDRQDVKPCNSETSLEGRWDST